MKEHLLQGLEPDNLLAFLALLGCLRALEHAELDWRPRVDWTGMPLRPRLVLSKEIERAELLEAIARGAAALAEVHSFSNRMNVDYTKAEARGILRSACDEADRLKVDLLTALMSDAVVKDDKVRVTPFCAMFGQGHQNFLERLERVPKGFPPKELQKETTAEALNAPEKLEAALFRSWERTDRTQSFRWDPLEDRRYALRFDDPSSDKGMTVHGANRLASLALPLLPVVPRRERGEVRLYAVGTSWSPGSGLRVSWPIWSRPTTLRSVVAMIAVCTTEDLLPGLGISAVYSCERINVGKFFNFTRALSVGGT